MALYISSSLLWIISGLWLIMNDAIHSPDNVPRFYSSLWPLSCVLTWSAPREFSSPFKVITLYPEPRPHKATSIIFDGERYFAAISFWKVILGAPSGAIIGKDIWKTTSRLNWIMIVEHLQTKIQIWIIYSIISSLSLSPTDVASVKKSWFGVSLKFKSLVFYLEIEIKSDLYRNTIRNVARSLLHFLY